MKNFVTKFMFAILLMAAFSLSSCQEEFEELPNNTNEEAIVASSSTAKLIERASSKDGSFDNIVDGASCFAVQFPYTVNVDGLDITIDSIEDLELIEEIFDTVETDDDILEILFPITITLADYSEIVINSKEELRSIAKECIEGGDDDDIECIDFVYPVTLYSFSVNLEKTSTVTVENDRQLRRFFGDLEDHELVSFDFPLTLEQYDGTKITVENNAELALALENAEDMCDEDDDDDYNDDDFTKERLDNYLVECPWLVRDVIRSSQDQSAQYFEYLMNFKEDGTVIVKDRVGNSIEGNWSTRVGANSNRVLLKLEFTVLVDFNLEWFVYELGDGIIKFYANDGADKILMKRFCVDNDTPDTLRGLLKECNWIIKKVKLNNEEINRLLGYEFSFLADGVVTLSNKTTTSQGTWAITTNAQGRLVMAITMGDEPGVSFEWLISDLRNERLKFSIEGTYYELILERNCDDDENDEDVTWIRGIFDETKWEVDLFSQNEDDITEGYATDTYSFTADGEVIITNPNDQELDRGSWRVYRNSEGTLEMILNFSDNSNYHPLANDYVILEVEEDEISLKHKNDDGSYDRLDFELIE
ncbi:hypothetical protein MWU65_03620 [Cellulophaga sp. F20128]|uniref:hypothetical protein n=1 Tax=Cellulophaga sp. F20128 TaxID=2926413 RepID=UPI001FF526CE|nr:hypothetical protein [Cellulophaga sp. F20128]MCK0156253.1 hypothetical protein [Cellulophaga sp. F20128]